MYVRGSVLVSEPDMCMLSQAFCYMIKDRDIYVQRNALDLLIACIPLRER